MENAIPFSNRLQVAAGAAEVFIVPVVVAESPFRSPNITHIAIEPDAANVTLIEAGFIESVTGAFMPRWDTTSTLGRREWSGIMQTGPRGSTFAVRITAAAATSARVCYDGMMVDG